MREANSLERFIESINGRLIIIKEIEPNIYTRNIKRGKIRVNRVRRVLVKCYCGKEFHVDLPKIRSGHTKSCGCLVSFKIIEQSKTHGLSHHPLYNTWSKIIARCENVKDPLYKKYYGSRGIKICSEWRNDFAAFHKWCIENGWERGLDIDRRNNNGNYEPSNCRVVPRKINARNKRNNRFLEHRGEVLCVSEWAERFKIEPTRFRSMLTRHEFSIEKTIRHYSIN